MLLSDSDQQLLLNKTIFIQKQTDLITKMEKWIFDLVQVENQLHGIKYTGMAKRDIEYIIKSIQTSIKDIHTSINNI